MMIYVRRIALLLVTGLLLLYAAACTYLYVTQDSQLFFPGPVKAENQRLYASSEISFELNDQHLSGWYIPGRNQLTLMYFGGNGEELSDRIEDMRRLGDYGLFMINYRGFGSSSGFPGEAGMKSDAVALFDKAVARLGLEPQNIVLMGRSLGSGIAAYVAAQRDTAGLILITPYDSIQALAKAKYPVMPVSLLLKHPFNTLADTARINEKALILMAEADSVIPHIHTENLIAHWHSPFTLLSLPGIHSTVVDSVEYDQAVKAFLEGLQEQDLH